MVTVEEVPLLLPLRIAMYISDDEEDIEVEVVNCPAELVVVVEDAEPIAPSLSLTLPRISIWTMGRLAGMSTKATPQKLRTEEPTVTAVAQAAAEVS